MINEQIENIFIENIKANMGKNKPIAKDDIIDFIEGYGIEINRKQSIDTILEIIDDNSLMNKLCEAFNEFIYIPNWKVAEYFGIETNELNKLLENNIIKADTKVGSFYDRRNKRNVEYDLYNFDVLFKYNSEQLKELYNKAFNHSKYNIRLETTTTEGVQNIINELSKLFIVSDYSTYEHRNKDGYYSYFNIELLNNNEQQTNVLLTQINSLKAEIQSLKDENRNLKHNNKQLEVQKLTLETKISSLEGTIGTSKAYIELLENKIECSKIKNERNGGRKHKFNDNQINDILKRRNEGKSIRALAKEFNCSVGLIHKLINEHNKKSE